MANLLPEKIKQLDGLDLKGQVRTIYDYVEYMQEQLEWYSTSKHLNDVYDMYQTIQGLGQRFEVMEDEIEQKETEIYNALDQAKQEATDLLTTANGGHVAFVLDQDDKPCELVIMDSDDINTAQKIWRWNANGLGYSSNGYNGTFGLAMTANGAIVADYITTGHLSADRIQGGTMRLGGVASGGSHNYGNGTLEMYDASEALIGKWSRDGIQINKGSININNAFQVSNTGVVRSKNTMIDGYLYAYQAMSPITEPDQSQLIGGGKFIYMQQAYLIGGYGFVLQDNTFSISNQTGYLDFLQAHTYGSGGTTKIFNDVCLRAVQHDLTLSAAWKIKLESKVHFSAFANVDKTGYYGAVRVSGGGYRQDGDLVIVAMTVWIPGSQVIDESGAPAASGLPVPGSAPHGSYIPVLNVACFTAAYNPYVSAYVTTAGELYIRTGTALPGSDYAYVYGFYFSNYSDENAGAVIEES